VYSTQLGTAIETLKLEIAALKQQNEAVPDTHDYNESDTRRYLLLGAGYS
jgi:hypothetical protein